MRDYNIKEEGFKAVYKGVPPFMKFDGGYGYYGVLLENEETGELQCHLCGRTANNIAKHIFHSHKNISVKEYRKKIGINLGTPLMSEATRKKIKNNFLNLTEEKQKETIKRLQGFNKENHREKKIKYPKKEGSLEYNNKFGTCPEQAKTKFWEEFNKLGKIPSNDEMSGGLRSLVYTRFGSYREALLAWGVTEQQYREHVVNGHIKVYETRQANDFFPKYNRETVRKQYSDFFFKNKRFPTWGEVRQYGLPTRSVFQRAFEGKTKSEVQNMLKVKSLN